MLFFLSKLDLLLQLLPVTPMKLDYQKEFNHANLITVTK